jgi:hypothetical protein
MIFEKPLDRMKGVAWYKPPKRRKVMMRAKMIGLMLCALTLVVAIVPGYTAETSVKAWAVWQGQGRFYKATETLALFSGYFEGVMEAENKEGELNAASMICPGMLEVNLTDGTQQGWGRCVMVTGTGDRVYAGWSCTGTHLEGCAGSFNVRGGTGKFSSVSGDSTFVVRSTVAEYVATIPEGGVTANFTGQAAWSALKYTTP